MIFTLTPLVISDAQADPDTAHALDFVESTLEGAAPFGYDRNFLDPGHRASRKTPAFVDARLATLEQLSLDAGCPSVLESAWAGRYGAGSAGSFQAVDAHGTVVEGTYLNDHSGLSIDGTFGATAFGDVESDWGAGSSGGMVRKFLYGLGPDEFVAGFAVANTTRNGYVFGVQGSCPEAWEVYGGWFGAPLEAPEPPEEWIHQFGTTTSDFARSIDVDPGHRIAIAGDTQGSLGGNNSGSNDAFVRVLGMDGQPVWTHQLGTPAGDAAAGIAFTANGEIVLAGTTGGNISGMGNFGGQDVFLRRLTADGSPSWTHQYGTTSTDVARALSIDSHDQTVLVGYTFGDFAGQNNVGGQDGFVLKVDPMGTEVWSHGFGTPLQDLPRAVATAPDEATVVVGETRGSLGGGGSMGGYDAFVRKLDDTGNEVWTHQFGTPTYDVAMAVDVASDGTVLVAGITRGDVDNEGSHGFDDAFVRALSPEGAVLWTHQFGTDGNDTASGVRAMQDGTIVVVGRTSGDLMGQDNQGGNDAFVATYGADGTPLGVRLLGSSANEQAVGIEVATGTTMVVAGYTEGDLSGTGSSGGVDSFVAHLSSL